ncbi:hypothetical protein K456DRAFT_1929852 [Colletotrichum gloeosporioides 23]|nr:hypothetical protein K456DRAFT_1929852 [Colletotrichum gloeosporioides 23]
MALNEGTGDAGRAAVQRMIPATLRYRQGPPTFIGGGHFIWQGDYIALPARHGIRLTRRSRPTAVVKSTRPLSEDTDTDSLPGYSRRPDHLESLEPVKIEQSEMFYIVVTRLVAKSSDNIISNFRPKDWMSLPGCGP